jgi:hypothetical protein
MASDPSSLESGLLRFIPSAGPTDANDHAQAVAIRAICERTITPNPGQDVTVTFRSKARNGGVTLKPTGDGVMSVFVENFARNVSDLPGDVIRNERRRTVVRDSDFELVYEALVNPPETKFVPEIPVTVRSGKRVTRDRKCFGTTIKG